MQHDEPIWQVIGHHHCAYRVKTDRDNFCRNEYNLTGQCRRAVCPLANSRYATVREVEGVLYLFIKTIERAHTPSRLWERVKLSRNEETAITQIEQALLYWPEHMLNKCKRRMEALRQMLSRMRSLATTSEKSEFVPVIRKQEKRLEKKEQKAEVAAHLSKSIEQELMHRLKEGTYGGIYNLSQEAFEQALEANNAEFEDEMEEEDDIPDTYEPYESDQDIEDDNGVELADEEGDAVDDEEKPTTRRKRPVSDRLKKSKPDKKKKHVEIEYETEPEPAQMHTARA